MYVMNFQFKDDIMSMALNGWCKKGVQCVNELLPSHVRQYSALSAVSWRFRAWTRHFVSSDMRRHRKTLTYLQRAYAEYRYSLEVFPVGRNLYRWRINYRFFVLSSLFLSIISCMLSCNALLRRLVTRVFCRDILQAVTRSDRKL